MIAEDVSVYYDNENYDDEIYEDLLIGKILLKSDIKPKKIS